MELDRTRKGAWSLQPLQGAHYHNDGATAVRVREGVSPLLGALKIHWRKPLRMSGEEEAGKGEEEVGWMNQFFPIPALYDQRFP